MNLILPIFSSILIFPTTFLQKGSDFSFYGQFAMKNTEGSNVRCSINWVANALSFHRLLLMSDSISATKGVFVNRNNSRNIITKHPLPKNPKGEIPNSSISTILVDTHLIVNYLNKHI
jgi:hypothetical protein